MDMNELTNEDIRTYIIISLHLRCNNSIDLIMLFNQKIRYIHEAIFVWIANSRLNSYRNMMPKKMMRVSAHFENKIKEGNEKFWINVLCSNIYDLPEIASEIGRNQYRLLKYNSFLNRKFPSQMISTEIFQYNQKPKCFSFIYYVSMFDFFFMFAFCALFTCHVFFLSSSIQMNEYITKFFVIKDFTTNYVLLLTDLWNTTNRADRRFKKMPQSEVNFSPSGDPFDVTFSELIRSLAVMMEDDNQLKENLTLHWKSMMNNFSSFASFMSSYEFRPLEDLITTFYLLVPKLETYIISYMVFPDFSQSSHFFPFQEFNDLNSILDTLFLRIFEVFQKITHKQTRISNIYFYVVVSLISVILVVSIVWYCISLRQRTIRLFESFRTANKAVIAEKCHGQFVKTARNPRFHFIKALPATTVYFSVLFVSVLILIAILFMNKHSIDSNRNRILLASNSFSSIERTYIWLVSSITHYLFLDENLTTREEFESSLIKCDQIGDSVLRNYSMQSFRHIVIDDLMKSIGKTLISFTMPSLLKWKNMLYASIVYNNEKTLSYSYFSHYVYARFFMYVIVNVIIYLLLAYFLLEIEPYYKWALQEFENKAQEAGILIQFELQKVKDDEFPLNFVLVNKDEKILFATDAAKVKYSMHVGKRLKTGVEFDHEIKKLTEEKTENYVEYKSNDNYLVYIVPSYDFSTKSIKFKNALVFWRKDVSTVFSIDFYRKLFYTIYPSYIEIDTKLPMTIETTLKQQYLIIVVKINGFNQWADSNDLETVSNYRQILSLRISELCNEDGTFCRIRETSDTVFIGMKHEQKTTARWDLLKTSVSFANSLMEMVNSLNNDFELANSKVSITMFKSNEPKTVLGNHRMQVTDFKSDTIFKSEQRAAKAIVGSVVYTPQLKETNITNASKIESCYTADGDLFDFWLVV